MQIHQWQITSVEEEEIIDGDKEEQDDIKSIAQRSNNAYDKNNI